MCNFEIFRTKYNINKAYIMAKIFLFLNLLLILGDIIFYFPKLAETPKYINLFFSHIVGSLVMSCWILLYKRSNNLVKNKANLKYFTTSFLVLLFACSMLLSSNTIFIENQASAFLLTTLSISVFIHLNKTEALIILTSSSFIFIILLSFMVKEPLLFYQYIKNILFTNIFSYVALYLNFNSFKSHFHKNDELIKSKCALEEANQELQRIEKNRTKLFTNISHELKTPINVIYGAQQLLDIQLDNNYQNLEKCKSYNAMIKQNSFRLIRLINNILDMSKIDDTVYEIKRENINIVESVENIVSSVVEFVNEKDLNIIFDTDVEELIIAVDPDKLERIILNLISNAIKFTDCGGSIFVNIYSYPKNTYISVRDTGIGIDEAHQQLIFDRFAQIDDSLSRNAEGTGIGLALVKSLMLLHNGDITLKSSPGNGSEFCLRFPNQILNIPDNSTGKPEYKRKSYKNKIERIEIEFSDIYK